MHTAGDNDAKGISRLALLASAAATAAFVISQTRLLQRLAELAPAAPGLDGSQPADTSPAAALDELSPQRPHTGDTDSQTAPPARNGSSRRVSAARPARNRRAYGLPVRHRGRRHHQPRTAGLQAPSGSTPLAVAVTAPGVAHDGEEEFDAEYIRICEAIARDGRADEEGSERGAFAVAGSRSSEFNDVWWLPAPRLRYILAALAYIGTATAAGTDPVTLAIRGVRALASVNSASDAVLLGWLLCGLVVTVPLGSLVARSVSLATRGKLHLPGVFSGDAAESAGWGLRLIATSAFVAGTILYTPHALAWALNTDYPVAAVSSSSMSPSLREGELVLIDGVDNMRELHLGDIVAFTHDGGLAVLRISGFTGAGVVAHADAGPQDDLIIRFDRIAGRVLTVGGAQVKLPLLGNISLLGERTVDPGVPLTSLP